MAGSPPGRRGEEEDDRHTSHMPLGEWQDCRLEEGEKDDQQTSHIPLEEG